MRHETHCASHVSLVGRLAFKTADRVGCGLKIRFVGQRGIDPRRSCCLTLFFPSSSTGDVTLWLPDNFSGLVQLNTRKGEIHVLPRLLETAKVLKQTDFEALIVVGSGVAPNGQLTDLCQLNSHRGKVIVGFDGMDRHLEKTGFWKKLSDFFKGNP